VALYPKENSKNETKPENIGKRIISIIKLLDFGAIKDAPANQIYHLFSYNHVHLGGHSEFCACHGECQH
jgi:hypothetical protein